LAVNKNLWTQFEGQINKVSAWFWGHEHFYVAYEPYTLGKVKLKRGRLIGHGAVPMPTEDEHYQKKHFADTTNYPVPKQIKGTEMQSKHGYFFNGFAMLTLNGKQAKCDYYALPLNKIDVKTGIIQWGPEMCVYSEKF